MSNTQRRLTGVLFNGRFAPLPFSGLGRREIFHGAGGMHWLANARDTFGLPTVTGLSIPRDPRFLPVNLPLSPQLEREQCLYAIALTNKGGIVGLKKTHSP